MLVKYIIMNNLSLRSQQQCMQSKIGKSDRSYIVSYTGSGKTELIKQMLIKNPSQYYAMYIADAAKNALVSNIQQSLNNVKIAVFNSIDDINVAHGDFGKLILESNNAVQSFNQPFNKLNINIDALSNILDDDNKSAIIDSITTLQNMFEDIEEPTSDVESLSKYYSAQEDLVEKYTKQVSTLQTQITDATKYVNNTKEYKEKTKRQSENQKRYLTQKNNQLNEEIKSLNATIANNTLGIKQCVDQIKKDNDMIQSNTNSMTANAQSIKNNNEQIDTAKHHIQGLEQRKNSIFEKKNTIINEINVHQKSISMQKDVVKKALLNYNAQLEIYNEGSAKVTEAESTLQKRKSSLEEQQEQLLAKDGEINKLQNIINKLNERASRLTDSLQCERGEKEVEERERRGAEAEKVGKQAEINNVQNTLTALEEKQAPLLAKQGKINNVDDGKNTDKDKIDVELSGIEGAIEKLKKAEESLIAELNGINSTIDNSTYKINDHERTINTCTAAIRENVGERKKATGTLQQKRQDREKLTNLNDSLLKQVNNAKKVLQPLQTQCNLHSKNLKTSKDNVTNTVNALDSTVEKMKDITEFAETLPVVSLDCNETISTDTIASFQSFANNFECKAIKINNYVEVDGDTFLTFKEIDKIVQSLNIEKFNEDLTNLNNDRERLAEQKAALENEKTALEHSVKTVNSDKIQLEGDIQKNSEQITKQEKTVKDNEGKIQKCEKTIMACEQYINDYAKCSFDNISSNVDNNIQDVQKTLREKASQCKAYDNICLKMNVPSIKKQANAYYLNQYFNDSSKNDVVLLVNGQEQSVLQSIKKQFSKQFGDNKPKALIDEVHRMKNSEIDYMMGSNLPFSGLSASPNVYLRSKLTKDETLEIPLTEYWKDSRCRAVNARHVHIKPNKKSIFHDELSRRQYASDAVAQRMINDHVQSQEDIHKPKSLALFGQYNILSARDQKITDLTKQKFSSGLNNLAKSSAILQGTQKKQLMRGILNKFYQYCYQEKTPEDIYNLEETSGIISLDSLGIRRDVKSADLKRELLLDADICSLDEHARNLYIKTIESLYRNTKSESDVLKILNKITSFKSLSESDHTKYSTYVPSREDGSKEKALMTLGVVCNVASHDPFMESFSDFDVRNVQTYFPNATSKNYIQSIGRGIRHPKNKVHFASYKFDVLDLGKIYHEGEDSVYNVNHFNNLKSEHFSVCLDSEGKDAQLPLEKRGIMNFFTTDNNKLQKASDYQDTQSKQYCYNNKSKPSTEIQRLDCGKIMQAPFQFLSSLQRDDGRGHFSRLQEQRLRQTGCMQQRGA